MPHSTEDLYVRFKKGPSVLFLGQNYLKLESGSDPFLLDILRKYNPDQLEESGYRSIFEGQAQEDVESSIAWMHTRSERLTVPSWLEIVASHSWNAVFTSAIDNLWYRTFRSEWRELHPLFEAKYRPSDARNRISLHCTFLFGCVNRTAAIERPPLTKREWLRRKQEAVRLIAQLPEIVTPFGLLIIEGYAFEDDWFSLSDLIPLIDEFNPGQVHMFSVSPELRGMLDLADLAAEGKIALHTDRLATWLLNGEQQGYLQLGLCPEETGGGPTIQLEDRVLSVLPEVWNQVSRSAMIVDDRALEPPRPMSKEKKYQDFLTFLSESSYGPVWSAYSKGFAFHRHFEERLLDETLKRLGESNLQKAPIILHGQTGTGKTVALASLAYEIRHGKKYPVLYIRRQSQRPVYDDIDVFCKWAEDNGAKSILVVWDGMVEADQYYNLLHYLTGGGRKAVLVGSNYRISEGVAASQASRRTLIEAPAELTSDEIERLPGYLDQFDPTLNQYLKTVLSKPDATFFTWLYRLLPATRGGLRRNLVQEVQETEKAIALQSGGQTDSPMTSLGYALWKAGAIMPKELSSESKVAIAREEFTEPQELIGLVMVPGRLGLRAPIELVLRVLGKNGWSNLIKTLSRMDIFRWHEDTYSGQFHIGPRNTLEAQIIAQARLGGAEAEIAFSQRLLLEVYDDGTYESPEVQFAVDLLRGIGPNGQYRTYFEPHFLSLSDTLKELREKRGVKNARLMLQEAVLLREYVVYCDRNGISVDGPALLNRAESTLKDALEVMPENPRTARLRSIILVELGANTAQKTRASLEVAGTSDLALRLFKEAKGFLYQAKVLSPDDYHPIDVLAWMTEALLNSGDLDLEFESEVKADILHIFSLANPDYYDPEQRERFHQKRMKIGELIGRHEMTEEAFQALALQGSKAGYYLRASQIAGQLPNNRSLYENEAQRCDEAVAYLEQYRLLVASDSRCLYLLLRLWWMAKTRNPILAGERHTVAFSREEWQYALGLITELLETQGPYPAAQLKFLQGLATFHLGYIENAITLFRELEHDQDAVFGATRIIKHYLASTFDGKPRVFSGTIAWIDDKQNKAQVYVEDLRCKINLRPEEFGGRSRILHKGDPIGRFHIAFNFIGPIAEPVHYYRGGRG